MGTIEDFEKRLRKHGTPYALWHKIDLHNHSPSSHDFAGNRASAVEDYAHAIREKRLSVVMFTDHERLPDKDFAHEVAHRSGALIVAGLELNVFVDAIGKPIDKVGKELCFHLLIGLDPDGQRTPSYWVEHLQQECRGETRKFGDREVKGLAASIDQIHKALSGSGAFLIPAHLHSGDNAFKSRSVDVVYSDAEFLRWSREFFTALDVRSDKTAAYFDGKHAETNHLEIGCIKSSDAHRASDLGAFPCWAQMQKVSFGELKAALELPSRLSRTEPGVPSAHILGINVQGEFLRDFWMSFSPHANVMIGVKGSGKTSVLECVRYALGTEVPHERAEDVGKHLAAILGPAGRVRVLIKRDDGAKVLVERRIAERRFRAWFEDDREVVVESAESLRFPAAILGWHEIEHAATDRQIRRLHMDAIAGREETKRFTDEARLSALSIRNLHESAAAKYDEFRQLAATVRLQESLREGLQQLKDANLIELRDQMAAALADREEILRLRDHLQMLRSAADSESSELTRRVQSVLQTDQFTFSASSPLVAIAARAKRDLEELESSSGEFLDRVSALVTEKIRSTNSLLSDADSEFGGFSAAYRDRLAQFPLDVQRLLESHREVLEKTKDLPNLKARLADLRAQIEEALGRLGGTCEAVAHLLDERLALRANRVAQFNDLVIGAGVQLSVVSGVSREDEFSAALSQFGQTRDIFQLVRARHSGVGRFHRVLKQCYEDLRADLASGDHVVFARAEFGHLITVLEDDDLDIRFAVGKPGEAYSPIDQLSAGQRCTAIFPILLKLKDGPLIVDQPEDNLDNRHIARSVAPVLIEDKRSRQIIMTSHNANLVVLSDPESISVFEAEKGQGDIRQAGFLCNRESDVTGDVLDILDGGEKALALRTRKYGRHR